MLAIRVLLLLCLAIPCFADSFRVCADNRNVPPYIYAKGLGVAQYLLLKTAQNLQLPVRLSYAPQPRCLHDLGQGLYEAALTVSSNALVDDIVSFPRRPDGQIDAARAYGRIRIMAFRLKGNPASWDGKQFSHLHQPVLYEKGVPMLQSLMSTLAVPSKASAWTPIEMIAMLRLQRADIALGLEPAVIYALQTADPDHQFEIIEPPIYEALAFLGVSKSFYAKNPVLAERIWDELQHIQQTPEWLQIREQVMQNQLSASAAGLEAQP